MAGAGDVVMNADIPIHCSELSFAEMDVMHRTQTKITGCVMPWRCMDMRVCVILDTLESASI